MWDHPLRSGSSSGRARAHGQGRSALLGEAAERLDLARALLEVGRRLEHEIEIPHLGPVEDLEEPLDADETLTDPLVTVAVRAPRVLRVVRVDQRESFGEAEVVELGEARLAPFGVVEAVARREQVARVDAEIEPFVADFVEQRSGLGEP